MTFTRTLGRSGIQVSALGLGCWAIGGQVFVGGQPEGWGQVDDAESIRAIHAALDMGVNFLDTSCSYGAGHSERIIGQALRGRREKAVVATKFGNVCRPETREHLGHSAEPDYIRAECDRCLARLGVDSIDLYQFHMGRYEGDAVAVRDVLEELVTKGKVRFYGWSTDDPAKAALFAKGRHCCAIQQSFSVFHGNAETLAVCEKESLASIIRNPLQQGMLSGKFNANSTFPPGDVRHKWNLTDEDSRKKLARLDRVRPILTSGGRTMAQGALAWLWARSPATIPIPGFKTVAQAVENAGALAHGPLTPAQMREIDGLRAL